MILNITRYGILNWIPVLIVNLFGYNLLNVIYVLD